MKTPRRSLSLCGLSLTLAACAASPERPAPARLFDGYGGYHRQVEGASPEVQRWLDQGLQLVYGFNHDEGLRSFREAARLDPDCAMAWWGVAYANGIDVNDTAMSAEASREGYRAIQRALKLSTDAAPVERALIEAQAARFAAKPPEDRAHLDQAYADAMGRAWDEFPGDADVGTLYAESLMVLQAWDYWTREGEPVGRAPEIVGVLQRAMELDPRHPGANHFFIHAVEASPDVSGATVAADRLADLVPGSGHLVHMPSHVYINTGRYADAADANERAIEADERYFETAPPPQFYSLYYIHNIHFLAFAAMMEGRYEVALDAARRLEAQVPDAFVREFTELGDGLLPATFHVLIRFGRWQEILAEPEYPAFRKASRAIRRYARAIALANLGRTQDARGELAALDALIEQLGEGWSIGVNPAAVVLGIARDMAEGEILWREGRAEEAYAMLRSSAEKEDALVYDEPPGWMQPVRHALGALLLAGGRAQEAAEVYEFDLRDNPENGWSLLGLQQAYQELGRNREASMLQKRLDRAWARADVELPASCFCALDADA